LLKLPKDPLVHFLGAGLALFLIASAVKPADDDEETIIVDRAALLEFIQYRSKAFESSAAARILDAMNESDRARLIEDYVREEALAREAETMGLEENDYVIRQRMVQKVEFLAEATAAPKEANDALVMNYYDANRERYTSPPSATLTHVFISTEKRSAEEAGKEARAILSKLRAANAGFNDASGHGDRFIFHKNYVERTVDYIASQLGPEVGAALADTETPLNQWIGPYTSQYGEHLIFIAARQPAGLPPLDEIHDLVTADLTEELRRSAIDSVIDDIVARYKVDNRLSGGE